jgi:hypothetical protein
MSDDLPGESTDCMPESYWETLPDGGDETILDEIRASSPEWDLLSATIAGEAEDGRVLFCLVIRRRVNDDGNLILSERYVRVDLDQDDLDERITWLSNGIERRMQGSLPAALRVLYAALPNGDAAPDDPMLLDSRSDGLQHTAEELSTPLDELLDDEDDEPESERTESGGKRVSAHESVSEQDNDLQQARSAPKCSNCGREIEDRERATNLGSALGKDTWVHHKCPQDDEEGDA